MLKRGISALVKANSDNSKCAGGMLQGGLAKLTGVLLGMCGNVGAVDTVEIVSCVMCSGLERPFLHSQPFFKKN